MPQQPATGTAAYRTAVDFANISWSFPMDIRFPPGETNRLFVMEETGRIIVITNLVNPTRTVFLDLTASVVHEAERGLLAMEFHPGYATNGYFYITRQLITNSPTGSGIHNR
jgi:hypothetical protein